MQRIALVEETPLRGRIWLDMNTHVKSSIVDDK
jgi:hypothetical protein